MLKFGKGSLNMSIVSSILGMPIKLVDPSLYVIDLNFSCIPEQLLLNLQTNFLLLQ